jgi:hypothetical protein
MLFLIALGILLLFLTFIKLKKYYGNELKSARNVFVVSSDADLERAVMLLEEYDSNASTVTISKGIPFGRWGVNLAIMFTPGKYNLKGKSLRMSYNSGLYGLGKRPEDVEIYNGRVAGCIYDGDCDLKTGGAFVNNREIQNIFFNTEGCKVETSEPFVACVLWFTSFGCPLRRVNITGNLLLTPLRGSSASGCLISSCNISETISSPGVGQNQFTFVDCTAKSALVPADRTTFLFVRSPISRFEDTCVPFECKGIPRCSYSTRSVIGTSLILSLPSLKTIERPYLTQAGLVRPGRDISTRRVLTYASNLKDAQAALLVSESDVVLLPGSYEGSLILSQENSCLIGLGVPVLRGVERGPVLQIMASNCTIAGFIVEAMGLSHDVLVKLGGNHTGTHIFDLTVRAVLNDSPSTIVQQMVLFEHSACFCSNLWIWRADHDASTKVQFFPPHLDFWENMRVHGGLRLTGNDNIFICLGIEHVMGPAIEVLGNDNHIYSLRVELPYGGKASAPYICKGKRHKLYSSGIYSVTGGMDVGAFPAIVVHGQLPFFNNVIVRNSYFASLGGRNGFTHALEVNGNLSWPLPIDLQPDETSLVVLGAPQCK